MSERKRLVFTAITVMLLGVVTGLFLGGDLLPSPAVLQQPLETTLAGEPPATTPPGTTDTTPPQTTDIPSSLPPTATGTTPPQATNTSSSPPATTLTGTAKVIVGQDYNPALLTIAVGTTVTWTNIDGEDHTVTEDNLLFDGFLAASGGTFSYTFNKAGTYTYYCFAHGWMVGKIIVK